MTDTEQKTPSPLEQLTEMGATYHGPTELDKGMEAVAGRMELADSAKLITVLNFDLPDEGGAVEIPADRGLLSFVLKKDSQDGSRRIPSMLIVGIVPTPEAQLAHPEGQKMVRELILSRARTKLSTAARGKDGEPLSMPVSVIDFVTSARSASALIAWKALRQSIVTELKKKVPAFRSQLNQKLLESVLASSECAEHLFGSVKQKVWVAVLNHAIGAAKQLGHEPGILETWLENRDSAEMAVPELDDLGELQLIDAPETEEDTEEDIEE